MAKIGAPPSRRSSRFTDVITACLSSMALTAWATRSASPQSSRRGLAVFDIAERTGTRADVAQHQEGRRAAAPAFAQVRAHGFFANGMQFLFAHQPVQPFIRLARGGAHLDPIRAAQRADVSFGMTLSLVGVTGIRSFCNCHCDRRLRRRIASSSADAAPLRIECYFIFRTFSRKPFTSTTSTRSPLPIFSELGDGLCRPRFRSHLDLAARLSDQRAGHSGFSDQGLPFPCGEAHAWRGGRASKSQRTPARGKSQTRRSAEPRHAGIAVRSPN